MLIDSESAVDGLDNVMGINLKDKKVEDIIRFHFPNLEVAFMFSGMVQFTVFLLEKAG